MTDPDPADLIGAADRLDAVTELAESGELAAEREQLAYLRGAADALRAVADQAVSKPTH